MVETMPTISDLASLAEARKLRRRLDFVYQPIPDFTCFKDCSACCFNSAETSLAEFANILAYLKEMPAEQRSDIIRRTVLYEFLHLVTLDHQCPFLKDGKCEVYAVRPLQCRFFGLYPDEDYEIQKDDSLVANKELIKEYKRHIKISLPADVVTYDIDQCDAARQNGSYLAMASAERELIEGRLATLEKETFEETAEEEAGRDRFSFLYCQSCLGDQEMQRLRVSAIKEFQDTGTHEVLDTMLALSVFDLR